MDCFFAAVEVRDNPALRGKPVAVGGAPDRRGVICASSYEARRYGVHSAMSSAKALQLCPQLLLLPSDFAKYRHVSQVIQQIFQVYTDKVEPLSLDEAYLDVSDNSRYQGSATYLASAIRQHIWREVRLTASAGIAPNKLLAKIASDWRKPNGQWVVAPSQIDAFIAQLPVKKLHGVGPATADKLARLGVHTCRQLQDWSLLSLIERFGKFGERLYQYCRGQDDREVSPARVRKSLSVEHTFANDLSSIVACRQALPELYAQLCERLRRRQITHITKQYIKLKFRNWQQTTIEQNSRELSFTIFDQLLMTGYQRVDQPVRLIGLGVKLGLEKMQLEFDFP
jgi:DNA polymerase-4